MKQKTYSTEIPKEQAFLIGFPDDQEGLDVSFEELKALADTAGLEVVRTLEVKLRDINPATYVGSGKVKEITLSNIPPLPMTLHVVHSQAVIQ